MIHNNEILPKGYNRNDRNSRGGGVLIAKKCIPTTPILSAPDLDIIAVELHTSSSTILCCLCPPKQILIIVVIFSLIIYNLFPLMARTF